MPIFYGFVSQKSPGDLSVNGLTPLSAHRHTGTLVWTAGLCSTWSYIQKPSLLYPKFEFQRADRRAASMFKHFLKATACIKFAVTPLVKVSHMAKFKLVVGMATRKQQQFCDNLLLQLTTPLALVPSRAS